MKTKAQHKADEIERLARGMYMAYCRHRNWVCSTEYPWNLLDIGKKAAWRCVAIYVQRIKARKEP